MTASVSTTIATAWCESAEVNRHLVEQREDAEHACRLTAANSQSAPCS